jgi:hypothetical protein
MFPRPHKLYVRQAITSQEKDDNGFEKKTPTEWVFRCDCRQSPQSGQVVSGANGESYAYSSIVYADKNTDYISAGTHVEVRDADEYVLIAGNVKRFVKNSMNARIWV